MESRNKMSMSPLLQTFLRGVAIALVAGSCSGGGCGGCGMEPLPGGFPAANRTNNAIQLRITDRAIATLEADPASLLGPLLGPSGLNVDIPPSCSGDPQVCCSGGTPNPTCGPLAIDLVAQNGDLPRLEVTPVQGAQRIDVIIRARLTSVAPIPVRYQGVNCEVSVDTAGGVRDGITLTLDINLPQDPDEGTTRMEVGSSTVDFENDDITIGGGFLCGAVNSFLKGFIVDQLTSSMNDMIKSSIEDQSCVPCVSGTTAECGAFADSCQSNVCMIGARCEQRLGVAGRMAASELFGGFSSGQLGRMDIYDVAGGSTETDDNGVTSSMYSGALPFATPRDQCGPPATEPLPLTDIAQSAFFTGNTRPDNGDMFDVGIGLHQQVLDHLAFAAYESGSLCLNITPGAVDLLTTDGLAPLLMPSVVDFLHGKNSPIIMGLRPQSPPTIKIGAGTTMLDTNGETIIIDPLLDIVFTAIQIDFFVVVDGQHIRVMTLTADIHLAVNLEINAQGEIQPVLGNTDNAISNTSVSNSEALRETDAELEEKVPVLLSLALPPLLSGLGSFALPSVGGLNIQVASNGILSIENNSMLAIFANLAPATMARVETQARLAIDRSGIDPVVHLSLGGDAADLEYSFQIDGGLWSPYTQASEVFLHRKLFAIAGKHRIAVRARAQGRPLSADLSPVELNVTMAPVPGTTYFHGRQGGQGCACESGGSSGAGALWLAGLVLLLLMRPWRQRYGKAVEDGCFLSEEQRIASAGSVLSSGCEAKRSRKQELSSFSTRFVGILAIVITIASLSGCTCSSAPLETCPGGCMEGAVMPGIIGRYSSLAASPTRVVAAAYDETLGDLVLVERAADGALAYTAIAGLPSAPPTYEPATYRDGIAGKGPDQGLWTSIALHQEKVAVAYVDADDGSLHLAREQEDGSYLSETIDSDTGIGGASYVSLSVSSTGSATIAYLAHGITSLDSGGLTSELRIASESSSWSSQVVDVGPISCGGLCTGSDVCVAGAGVEECKAPSGTCATGCADTDACIAGVCELVIQGSGTADMPDGVGLFAKLVRLSDDSMVLGYYDRILGTLKIATSSGTGFVGATNYEDPVLDTGMWLSMVVDSSDKVHLAFQDATGDRLLYASFASGTLSTPEIVDDGVRAGEFRTHPVGASASIALGRDRSPLIVYQDALSSDIEIATGGPGSWQHTSLMEGPRVDGFFIDTASTGDTPFMSHYFYDRAATPMGELEIVSLP